MWHAYPNDQYWLNPDSQSRGTGAKGDIPCYGHSGSDWHILYALERSHRRTAVFQMIPWIYQFQTGPRGFGGFVYGNHVDGPPIRDPGNFTMVIAPLEKAGCPPRRTYNSQKITLKWMIQDLKS